MPLTWNDNTERQLLLTIIATSSIATPNWEQIAGLMGDGATASAVRQKFNKMRKVCKEDLGEAGGSTPKGKPSAGGGKKAAGTPKKAGTAKRKPVEEAGDDGDDEEGMEDGSPKKKVKVKAEEEKVEDEDEF